MTHYPNTSHNTATSKRGWLAPLLTGAAGLAVGGLLATGITMSAADGPTGSQSECVAAIGHADEAIDLYSGAFGDAANAVDSYLINDYAGVDASTRNMNTAADNLEPVLMDYYTASGECLGGGFDG